MSPELLLEKLLRTATKDRFGHFYIFQGRGLDTDAQKEWAKTLIRRYWSEIEKRKTLPKDILNDSDILWVRPWDEEEQELRDEYVVADLKALTTFLGYRSLGGQRRFVVLEEMQRLSATVANRMLKILEEPHGDVTYLGLNPMGVKLLPTIESRAISHALAWPTKTLSTPLVTELQTKLQGDYPLTRFLEDAKKSWSLEELMKQLLAYEQQNDGPIALKQELLTLVKGRQKAQIFNQSAGPHLQGLYVYLTHRFRSGR